MNIENFGQIVYLAGPSSSGKTTFSQELVKKGWIHLEADEISLVTEIGLLEKKFSQDLAWIKQHLNNPSLLSLMQVVCGKNPDISPKDLVQFKKVCSRLNLFLEKRVERTAPEVFIHMLDEAKRLAELGHNVIMDSVPLFNEDRLFFSQDLIQTKENGQEVWKYKDVKFVQKLKFVSINRLMLNVIKRNQNPDNHRDPIAVIKQYSNQFKKVKNPSYETIDTLKTKELKKWIERAVKMDFFDVDPSHRFLYKEGDDIDQDLDRRVKDYFDEIRKLETSDDPKNKNHLCTKLAQWINMADTIASLTQDIFTEMNIPKNASEVSLSVHSKLNAKPSIIKD